MADEEAELNDVVKGARVFGAFLGWLVGNAGWLSAIAAVAFVACKVLAVSRGNFATAQILVVEGDTSKILLGTLLLVLPVALVIPLVYIGGPVLLALALGGHGSTDPERPLWKGASVFALAGLVAVAVLDLYLIVRFVPAGYLGAPVLALALVYLTVRLARVRPFDPEVKRRGRAGRALTRAEDSITPSGVVMLLAAALTWTLVTQVFPIVLNDEMWLPAMSASVRGEPQTVYLVAQREDETVLLFDGDRHVEILPTDAVEAPEPCGLDLVANGRTLSELLSGSRAPSLLPCPGR